ncbi:MAG TPA: hypothetical protein VIQ01_05550 [Burkholderiales bacterium]
MARDAFQRGCARLTDEAAHPMSGLLLHGFGFLLNLRAEYAEALAVADRAEALSARTGDPFLAFASSAVRGHAYMMQGRPQAAREALEHVIPSVRAFTEAPEQRFVGFIADPQVTVLAMLSLPLSHLGLVRQARERLQEAYTRARHLEQPMALLVALWFDALCAIRFGEANRLTVLAQEMHSHVEAFGLAQGKTACRWFRGWAEARRGKPLEAFREIRSAYEENNALGMICGSSETLGYAAEALVLQGDLRGAQAQLEEAHLIVNTYGERIYLPELLLTESAIARARGEDENAETSVRRAVAEAREQGARWLELLAITQLCESEAATLDDRRALATLVGQLKGIDTPAFAKAKAVLERDS